MHRLHLSTQELEHLKAAMWKHGLDLDEAYDTETNRTHQSIWQKIFKIEEKIDGLR